MTTAILLVAGLLWYLLHLFSTLSFGCEALIAWWFGDERFRAGLLPVASLFAVTLAAWLYADIVRPKPVRVPVSVRAGQALLVTVMLVMSVVQWGFFKPQSQDGRIYAYFQSEVAHWPVIAFFLPPAGQIYAVPVDGRVEALDPVLVELAMVAEESYRREFPEFSVPPGYGRAGGRYNGRLECTARQEVDAAWERAYEAAFQAYLAALRAEQAEVE